MESTFARKADMLRGQITEIVQEVKYMLQTTCGILERCMLLVERLNQTQPNSAYLTDFVLTYTYLSKCIVVFSELCRRLDILSSEEPTDSISAYLSRTIKGDMSIVSNVREVTQENVKVEKIDGEVESDFFRIAEAKSKAYKSVMESMRLRELTLLKSIGCLPVERLMPFNAAFTPGKANIGLPPVPPFINVFPDNRNLPPFISQMNTQVYDKRFVYMQPQQQQPPPPPPMLQQNIASLMPPLPAMGPLVPPPVHVVPPAQNYVNKVKPAPVPPAWDKCIVEPVTNQLKKMRYNRTPGAKHEVILTHLVSPEEFYVQIKCDDLRMLDDLKTKIQMHEIVNSEKLGNCAPTVVLKRLYGCQRFGHYAVVVENENNPPGRVRIMDWRHGIETDSLVVVHYLDYGNTCSVSLNYLRPMATLLYTYPVFAQKCYLSYIKRPDTKTEWSESDKTTFELFLDAAEEQNNFCIELVEKDSNREAFGVRLSLPGSDICINDKLVEFGVAESSMKDGGPKTSQSDLTYMPELPVGTTIPVKVTCLSKLNKIFCTKDYDKLNESNVLSEMTNLMNNYTNNYSPVQKPLTVGQYVLGKYEGKLWYRAQVIRMVDPESVKVLFLDYGNTETINVKDVTDIDAKYLNYPLQVIECRLENVDPDFGDTSAARDKVMKIVEEGDVSVKILSVIDGSRSVYNAAFFDKNGVEFTKHLNSKETKGLTVGASPMGNSEGKSTLIPQMFGRGKTI